MMGGVSMIWDMKEELGYDPATTRAFWRTVGGALRGDCIRPLLVDFDVVNMQEVPVEEVAVESVVESGKGNDQRAEDDFVDHDYEMEEDAELDADFEVNIDFGVDRNIPVEYAGVDYDNGVGFLIVSAPGSSVGAGGPRVDDEEDESEYGGSDELDSEHRCLLAMKNSNMTSKLIATHYLQKHVKDPDYSLTSQHQDVMEDFIIEVSLTKCRRARALALDIIYACKDGFKAGCRPILSLDGCFLKGYYGGQLLVAIGIDANDCIYPLAYAVVESENYESWCWFLLLLKKDFKIGNSYH
ncbi:hypothetical protein PTKIN_Ptkin12aG0057100 [Pterospermum kingtungense]